MGFFIRYFDENGRPGKLLYYCGSRIPGQTITVEQYGNEKKMGLPKRATPIFI